MKRLLEADATEFEQNLLGALRLERPSPELEQRMRAALGLGPLAAALPAEPVTPAAKTFGTWGAIAAGSVVAAVFIGGGAMLSGSDVPVGSEPQAAPAPIPPSEPIQPAPTPAVAPEPRAPEAAVEVTPAKPRSQPAHPGAPTSASLREEIRLIDSARVAVKGNEGARAIGILDQYARRFPSGTFKEEARLLRSEALKAR